MSIDLEDRLRAMYTAVAATTAVDTTELEFAEPELVSVRTPPAPITMRRVRIVALVAAAAAVVAGLVLVVSQHHDRKPTASLKDRTFAVPTYVPKGYALVQAEVSRSQRIPGFPDGGDEVAHLLYSGPGDRSIDVVSMRDTGAAPLPDTATAIGRRQPGGNRVGVSADGLTADELNLVVHGLWWVTPSMFTALAAKNGFVEGTYDAWTPPGDDPSVTIRASGSLQRELTWTTGAGLGFTIGGVAVSGCFPQPTYRTDDDRTVILRAFAPVDAFRVTFPDGHVLEVPAGMPPGLPNSRFATIRLAVTRQQLNVLHVECVGGQP